MIQQLPRHAFSLQDALRTKTAVKPLDSTPDVFSANTAIFLLYKITNQKVKSTVLFNKGPGLMIFKSKASQLQAYVA